MAVELIYSHIPKCGGVSFRDALLLYYQPYEIFHPWFWFGTRPEYKKAIKMWKDYPVLKDAWNKKASHINPNVRVIMGHFPMRLFDGLFPDATRIIWLRNPVDRVVSAYNHYKHNGFLVGDHTQPDKSRSTKMNMRDFIALPQQHNVMHHFFQTEETFAFIGIVERYQESLDLLQSIMGWKRRPIMSHKNKGEYKRAPSSIISRIEKYNRLDIELYEKYNDTSEA